MQKVSEIMIKKLILSLTIFAVAFVIILNGCHKKATNEPGEDLKKDEAINQETPKSSKEDSKWFVIDKNDSLLRTNIKNLTQKDVADILKKRREYFGDTRVVLAEKMKNKKGGSNNQTQNLLKSQSTFGGYLDDCTNYTTTFETFNWFTLGS